MFESYQYLPYHIDPIAFQVGPFSVGWYALMYLVGLGVVYWLLRYRIKQGIKNKEQETKNKILNSKFEIRNSKQSLNPKSQIQNKFQSQPIIYNLQPTSWILDFLLYAFFGLLIGGRLGYVFFYNLSYFAANPWAIISPFSASSGEFVGIYGMSYHGGLIGVLIVSWIFCRKRKIGWLDFAEFIVPAIPAGYFFGRIGNFLNGELYGRVTERPWGMYFPDDILGNLRHPSQLYEAFFEGLVLFFILWALRNRKWAEERLLAIYLIGYALARFGIEFFREPDEQIGYLFGALTLGQIFSLIMLVCGIVLMYCRKNPNPAYRQTGFQNTMTDK